MRPRVVWLLVFSMVAAIVVELRAQAPTPESNARERFNQVFVKVIVPVTPQTPKQGSPVVESWIAEQVRQPGGVEYFAVTDWIPVCDGLLADDVVDNRVRLNGRLTYCRVHGDIPERENGRLLVRVAGWTPAGGEANISLPDEPGRRAVGPVRLLAGKERERNKNPSQDPRDLLGFVRGS